MYVRRLKMTHLRNIFFDKDFTENGEYSGDLPEWDLTDLYKNINCPEIDRDLNWLEKECKNFAN